MKNLFIEKKRGCRCREQTGRQWEKERGQIGKAALTYIQYYA